MKKILALLLAIALIGSAVTLLKKRKQSVKDIPLPIPLTLQVKVGSATTERLEQTRPFLARLVARQTAEISSRLSGRIIEVLVRESQTVKEGDLLLRIDDREIASNIKAMKVSLDAQEKDVKYAKSLHERNRSLFKVGGLAREKFEASAVASATKQAALEATRQKIIGLEVQLSYLNLKAPFAGTVGAIISRQGSLAVPGKPLLSINSLERKLIFQYVPGDIAIQTGQEVFANKQKIGQIVNLYNDAENGLAVAEVSVEIPLLQPNNSYITIDLLTFADTGCRVPLNGLLLKKEGAQLMVYADGAFTPFPVTVIADNSDFALVDPCPTTPMALATAARLSSLPSLGQVLINRNDAMESNFGE